MRILKIDTDHKKIHEAIRAKFNFLDRYDNLPYNAGRGKTRNDLGTLFAEIGFNVGAEIGVRRGRFSRHLCKCNPKLRLYCIDPWMPYGKKYTEKRQDGIYREALKVLEPYNVTIIRETSIDALRHFGDETLDFIFIDGDHTFDYVAPDIIYWSKKVKSGGIVSVHDYYSFGWSGVKQAVDAYTFCHDIRPWYVTKELEPTAFWVKP